MDLEQAIESLACDGNDEGIRKVFAELEAELKQRRDWMRSTHVAELEDKVIPKLKQQLHEARLHKANAVTALERRSHQLEAEAKRHEITKQQLAEAREDIEGAAEHIRSLDEQLAEARELLRRWYEYGAALDKRVGTETGEFLDTAREVGE